MEDVAHALLVRGVGVRVDEAHRHGLDAVALQQPRDLASAVFVDRLQDVAGVVDPLRDLEAVAATDRRRGDVLVGVPEIFLRAAPDLDHVPEALRRHHCGRGIGARDQRVRGHGRAMGEEGDLRQVDSRRLDAAHHPVDRIGCGRDLRNPELAGVAAQDADVRERAADVYCDDVLRHALILLQWTSGSMLAHHRARAPHAKARTTSERLWTSHKSAWPS
jgi:hypothetical protein